LLRETLTPTSATNRIGLFHECAAALQFPPYFGESGDASEECLSDLEWLPDEGLVRFVTGTDLVLEKAPNELSTWSNVLN
jgi:hypothetical protein